jgi:hypothetical protein
MNLARSIASAFTALSLLITVRAATPFGNWNLVEPRYGPGPVSQISYRGGNWIMDGWLKSTNGLDWSGLSRSPDYELFAFGFGNGRWLASGSSVSVITCAGETRCSGLFSSIDGLQWTQDLNFCSAGIDFGGIAAVVYGGGRWILNDDFYGRYLTSTDGSNWTTRFLTPSFSPNLQTVSAAYANGTWVTMGQENGQTALFSSTNGLNWSRQTLGESTIAGRLLFGNGQWVHSGGRRIWSSVDGFNWILRYTSINYDVFNAMDYGNGRWVVTGNNFDIYPVGFVLGSSNATNWTELRRDTSRRMYNGVAYGSNQWLVVGRAFPSGVTESAAVLSSSNGVTWTDRTVISSNSFSALSFGSNRWVAVGGRSSSPNRATIATSTNGLAWTYLAPAVGGVESSLYAVAFGNGQWLALGSYYDAQYNWYPATLTSTNGTTWSLRAGGVGASLPAFGNGKWVAWGGPNVYTADPSNLTWTAQSLPPSVNGTDFKDLHFSNGLWVMVGSLYRPDLTNNVPVIVTSSNGTNWTQRTAPNFYGGLAAVHYAQGQWVAVGSEDFRIPECLNNISTVALVFASPDGVTWTRRETGLPRGTNAFRPSVLSGITWTGDEWAASGTYGTAALLTSPDAINWQLQPGFIGGGTLAYGNGKIVAANGNTLVASDTIVSTAPMLSIARFGSMTLLSWSVNKSGFTLQSTTNLLAPAAWADSVSPPAVVRTEFVFTNMNSGRDQFFRLKK